MLRVSLVSVITIVVLATQPVFAKGGGEGGNGGGGQGNNSGGAPLTAGQPRQSESRLSSSQHTTLQHRGLFRAR